MAGSTRGSWGETNEGGRDFAALSLDTGGVRTMWTYQVSNLEKGCNEPATAQALSALGGTKVEITMGSALRIVCSVASTGSNPRHGTRVAFSHDTVSDR